MGYSIVIIVKLLIELLPSIAICYSIYLWAKKDIPLNFAVWRGVKFFMFSAPLLFIIWTAVLYTNYISINAP